MTSLKNTIRFIEIREFVIWLLYNALLLTIAFLLERFLQMLVFLLLFNFFHNAFNYRFHSDDITQTSITAVKLCKIITIIIEILFLIFCKEIDISLYSNLFIMASICLGNCLIKFIIIQTFKYKERIIRKGINEQELIQMCDEKGLNELEKSIMVDYYCKGYKLDKIAIKNQYSVDNIKKIKAKLLKRLLN